MIWKTKQLKFSAISRLASSIPRIRRTASIFWFASCLVLCSSSASALTQQEVEDAVYNALLSAPISFNGAINTVPWMFPSFDGHPLGEWMIYASGYGDGSGSATPSRDSLRYDLIRLHYIEMFLAHYVTNDFPRFEGTSTNLLRHGFASITNRLTNWEAAQMSELLDISQAGRYISGYSQEIASHTTNILSQVTAWENGDDSARVTVMNFDDFVRAQLGQMYEHDPTNDAHSMLSNVSLGSMSNAVSSLQSTSTRVGDESLDEIEAQQSHTTDSLDQSIEDISTALQGVVPADLSDADSEIQNALEDLQDAFNGSKDSELVIWEAWDFAGVDVPRLAIDFDDTRLNRFRDLAHLIFVTSYYLIFVLASLRVIRATTIYVFSLAHVDESTAGALGFERPLDWMASQSIEKGIPFDTVIDSREPPQSPSMSARDFAKHTGGWG